MIDKKKDVGFDYIESLGEFYLCPKRKCSGKLVPVLARYNDGTTKEEWECVQCGKVVRQLWKLRRRNETNRC